MWVLQRGLVEEVMRNERVKGKWGKTSFYSGFVVVAAAFVAAMDAFHCHAWTDAAVTLFEFSIFICFKDFCFALCPQGGFQIRLKC